MSDKIHCMNLPLTIDRILDIINNEKNDKDARAKAVYLLFHLRDRVFQTPSCGLLPLELPANNGVMENQRTVEADVLEPEPQKWGAN